MACPVVAAACSMSFTRGATWFMISRIAAFELRLLDDDRGVIPPYDAIVLVGPRLAREAPDVVRALQRLDGILDESAMQRMNLEVDEQGRGPAEVARALFDGLRAE